MESVPESHADVIAAADFFTVDVWTKRGLVTHDVFFVMYHATRMVEIAGVITNPSGQFMAQVARNLTDRVDGFAAAKKPDHQRLAMMASAWDLATCSPQQI